MDLLADENVPRPVIERLRSDGWLVLSVAEQAAGISDFDVLAKANNRGVLIITHDQDFGELCVSRGLPVRGVILIELARLPLPSQVQRIGNFMKSHSHELAGHFVVLEPRRHRLRKLP